MKIRSRWLIRLAGRLIAGGSQLLFRSLKLHVWQSVPRTSPYAPTDEMYLYCIWHDGILGAIFSGDSRWMAALVSQHEDGSYVADALEAVGIRQIRGSSNRGGTAALKQMMEVAKDVHISIATDGPQGPRRVVKDGIVFLASKTGRRIVPIAFAARNAWKPAGRWTDLVIPRPFSRAIAAAGAPISIPASLNREQMHACRQELQQRMDELQLFVDAAVDDPSITAAQMSRLANSASAGAESQASRAA